MLKAEYNKAKRNSRVKLTLVYVALGYFCIRSVFFALYIVAYIDIAIFKGQGFS